MSSSAPALQRLRRGEAHGAVGRRRASAPRSRVASSRRTRLLTTTSSRGSGSGATAAPVTASIAVVALDDEHALVGRRLHLAVDAAPCSSGSAARRWQPTSVADRLDLRVALAERQVAHRVPAPTPARRQRRSASTQASDAQCTQRRGTARACHRQRGRQRSGSSVRRTPRQRAVRRAGAALRATSLRYFFSGSSFFLSLPAMNGLHGWAGSGPWSSTRR